MPEINEDEKICPYCAEPIKKAAIKCKHCGSDLTVPPPVSSGVAREHGGLNTNATFTPNILFEGHGSQWQNLGTFIVCGFMLLGALVAIANNLVPVSLGLLICAVILAISVVLRVMTTRYTITENSIERISGLLFTSTENVLMVRVKDIKISQGLMDRVLGLGSLTVVSSDLSSGMMQINSISGARDVYSTLRRQMERIATTQGVVKY